MSSSVPAAHVRKSNTVRILKIFFFVGYARVGEKGGDRVARKEKKRNGSTHQPLEVQVAGWGGGGMVNDMVMSGLGVGSTRNRIERLPHSWEYRTSSRYCILCWRW